MKLPNSVVYFFEDEEGLTVVEYVVGAGAIALALSTFFSGFDDILIAEINSIFTG